MERGKKPTARPKRTGVYIISLFFVWWGKCVQHTSMACLSRTISLWSPLLSRSSRWFSLSRSVFSFSRSLRRRSEWRRLSTVLCSLAFSDSRSRDSFCTESTRLWKNKKQKNRKCKRQNVRHLNHDGFSYLEEIGRALQFLILGAEWRHLQLQLFYFAPFHLIIIIKKKQY